MIAQFPLCVTPAPSQRESIVSGDCALLFLANGERLAIGHGYDDGDILLPYALDYGSEADYIVVCNPKIVAEHNPDIASKIVWRDTAVTSIFVVFENDSLIVTDNCEEL